MTHIICIVYGNTTSIGSPKGLGITHKKLKQSSTLTTSRQNLSLISNFENRIHSTIITEYIYANIWGISLPISFNSSWISLIPVLDLALSYRTDHIPTLICHTRKDRSRLIHPCLYFFGTTDNVDFSRSRYVASRYHPIGRLYKPPPFLIHTVFCEELKWFWYGGWWVGTPIHHFLDNVPIPLISKV